MLPYLKFKDLSYPMIHFSIFWFQYQDYDKLIFEIVENMFEIPQEYVIRENKLFKEKLQLNVSLLLLYPYNIIELHL